MLSIILIGGGLLLWMIGDALEKSAERDRQKQQQNLRSNQTLIIVQQEE